MVKRKKSQERHSCKTHEKKGKKIQERKLKKVSGGVSLREDLSVTKKKGLY